MYVLLVLELGFCCIRAIGRGYSRFYGVHDTRAETVLLGLVVLAAMRAQVYHTGLFLFRSSLHGVGIGMYLGLVYCIVFVLEESNDGVFHYWFLNMQKWKRICSTSPSSHYHPVVSGWVSRSSRDLVPWACLLPGLEGEDVTGTVPLRCR